MDYKPARGRFASQAETKKQKKSKNCVCTQDQQSRAGSWQSRKGNIYPHAFPTFSDFAFLALCTNLRPSFLAYQMEANIAMPAEGVRGEAAAQSTSQLGSEMRSGGSRAGAVTCRLLLSQGFSCWRAEAEGGRREGGGRGQAVRAGQSAGTFTSRPREVRARGAGGRCLPRRRTRASRRLSIRLAVLGLLFTTKLHAWQEERQPQSGRPGLQAVAPSPGFPLPWQCVLEAVAAQRRIHTQPRR